MDYVLAIDLGTSGCRSAVFDKELNLIGLAKREYPLLIRSEVEIEQDPEEWWEKVKETIWELGEEGHLEKVKAISISSQGISLTPVDREGKCLSGAISWLDTRAAEEGKNLKERYGRWKLYRHTGVISSPLYSLPKLMWLKKCRETLYQETYKFLLPMDMLLLRLTGKMVTEHTMASGTMYYNIATRKWDEKFLNEQGLDVQKLPPIYQAGTEAGKILPHVAEELGLSRDVIVAVGAQDQKCAAYGAGANASITTASIGTCTCITKLTASLKLKKTMRIPCFSYLQEGLWDFEGIINTTGSALQWFRDQFAKGSTFQQLDALSEKVQRPGSVRFYPNLSGAGSPHWEKGGGIFSELTLESGMGHCVLAILEGVAYNIRANLEELDRQGQRTEELRLFGGGAGSPLWCQIIADVINRPVVQMKSSDTALAGAARLAYKSLGIKTEPVPEGKKFYPGQKREHYEETYLEYEKFRKRACLG